MAKTTPAAPETQALVKARVEGMHLITPLKKEVDLLDQSDIDSQEEYDAADIILGRIERAIEKWDETMRPIIEPFDNIIKEAKKGKAAADTLNKDVSKGLEGQRDRVKGLMRSWRLREQERITAENRRIAEAKAKADAEAEAARLRAEKAKTPAARKIAVAQQIQAEVKAETLVEETGPAKTAEHSTARTIRKWRFTGTAELQPPTPQQFRVLLAAILKGQAPENFVSINYSEINKALLRQPELIEQCPGIELFDDVIIAGRR